MISWRIAHTLSQGQNNKCYYNRSLVCMDDRLSVLLRVRPLAMFSSVSSVLSCKYIGTGFVDVPDDGRPKKNVATRRLPKNTPSPSRNGDVCPPAYPDPRP